MDKNEVVEQHFRENYNVLIKRIRARVRDRNSSVPEDVVQESYYRALKYFDTFDPEKKSFEVWFNSILNNSFRKVKNEEKERGIVRTFNEEYDDVDDGVSCIEKEIVSALSLMKDSREKTILNMYYILGFKTKDIAEYLSMGHSNIRMIIMRWRKEMEKEYEINNRNS